MRTRARRWTRRIVLAALPTAVLAAAAMPSCGSDTSGMGGTGGSPTSSSSSSSSGLPCSPRAVKCTGESHDLKLQELLTIHGSTSSCSPYYYGYCGIGTVSGPDLVYLVRPSVNGTMHVELDVDSDASVWQRVVYAFAPGACGKPNEVIACKDLKYGATKFALKVTGGQDYPIVVDGRDGESGPFTLTVTLADPTCGDGIIDPGEDCDFGVKGSPPDGCDMICHFIHDPLDKSTDDCLHVMTWAVDKDTPLAIPGFTSGYTDDYQPCGAMGGGPDRVFGFKLASAGTLKVEAKGADFDVVLAAYTTCVAALDGLLACSDGPTPDSLESISLKGPAGSTFYIVVDGYDAKSFGAFTLSATLTP